MSPVAKTTPDASDDELTNEERAKLRELLGRSGEPAETGKPGKEPPAPAGDAKLAADMGVSLREMERIAREQTMAVLATLRAEEDNEARDAKISKLEAALDESKKKERKPNVISGLFRALWGTPPERDEAAEATGGTAA